MEDLAGPLDKVFKEIQTKWREFQQAEPFLDVLNGFIKAIDWTEPWIISILAIHVLLLIATLITRKNEMAQLAIALICMPFIFFGSQVNDLGRKHWQRFSTQDYFDKTGVFYCVVVSGPLLLVMLILLINYLLKCCDLLVKAKVAELKYKMKRRKGDAVPSTGSSSEAKKEK